MNTIYEYAIYISILIIALSISLLVLGKKNKLKLFISIIIMVCIAVFVVLMKFADNQIAFICCSTVGGLSTYLPREYYIQCKQTKK